MRYEDTSGSISGSAVAGAHDDADVLANGSNGPATGNVITGAGTTTGKAGADTPASGHVVAVRGASGADASDNGASLHVDGRFGTLAIDEHGNYKYVADGHAPQNFRDLFQYTLADSKGGRSVADLVISRGGEIKVADNAQKITPNADGTVTLPAGVDLNDVHVVGRDLVVDMPDGSQIVIVDGAVFVPQLVLGGVEVPSTNLAALLIDAEPKPAAGTPQSSGGNFDVPVPPLDPGVPLGDLIPPTDLHFIPPEFHEVNGIIDRKPTIEIQPDGQPASVAAVDSVDEKGLPTRNGGEPEGSGEEAAAGANGDPSEATVGTIVVASPDGVGSLTITDGNGVPHQIVVGLVVQGDFGTLTITGVVGSNYTYSYVLNDNTSGNDTHDDFTVTVTDNDGDQATATLRIDIIDDVPTARPDTDSIAAGQYGPATGNVITDASAGDAGDSDTGRDTVGADNAHISLVTGFNGSTDNSGPFVVNGQYGVLTMQADGSYSYTRNPGTPGGVNDVFNYTLTDGDGDTSTTTLTISIGDATPQTGENPLIRFDDDALPGGNPGGVGDDSPDTVNATGQLAGSGGDGPISFSVQTTGAPAGFSYVSGGAGIVLIQQNGHTVLTVTVNANGTYSVVQNAPIDHPAGSNENNQVFTINYTVTDQDNDSAPGTFTINVDDDTPTVGIADRGAPSLTVDESDLGTNATASFASNFTHSFGADGPAAAASLAYSLGVSAPGADSGLIDVATGQHVLLTVTAGGVVEGRTAVSGDLVFTVSVNGSGDVTLDQIRAVSHPDTSNPDDSVSLAANNLITLNLTATDHDGDTASQSLNIGQSLHFEDDGPTISLSGSEPSLTVDETVLATNASGSFAGAFNSAFGADGAGTVTYALSVLSNGANSGLVDTATGQAIVLVLNGGVVEGHVGNAAGALAFTVSVDASGNVTLDQIRAVVHPDASNPDDSVTLSADNLVSLTATVTDKDGDTATAKLDIGQNLNFEDDGPSITLSGSEPNLTVDETNLAANAGPTSFASAFTPVFGADGPAAANSLTYSLGITGGNGTLSGLVDTATGQNIVLVNNAGVIEGHVGNAAGALAFTVTVSASGAVSLDQIRAVVHPNTANPDDSVTLAADNLITLTATAHDGDGDTASATLNIGQNLNFEDDGPHANNDTDVTNPATDTAVGNVITGVGTTEGAANADQPGADGFGAVTNLVGFNGSTDGDPAGGFDVNGQYGTLHMNADGSYTYTRTPGSPGGATDTFTYTYVDGDGDPASATLTITIADSTPVAGTVNVGLDDDALAGGNPGGIGDDPDSVNATGNLPGSGGDAPLTFGVLLTGAPAGFSYVSGGAGIVLVQQGGVTVLTVTVNSATGAYSVVQNAPINHAAGGDENNQSFAITYTVTDSDTDVANGTININVDDDTPTVSANAGVQLDDDALAGGNAGGIGDDANATNTTGTLAHSYGADGAGSVAYLTTGAPAGFSYSLQGNGDLWVIQGATHVLTLTVNSTTGAYSVTQVAPIAHPAGSDENNVSFTISYNVTDHDGDSATGSIVVNVDDDTPTVSANAAVQLDDDALAGGNAGGIGDDANATNTSGTLAHSYGADGAGSVAYLTTGAPAGFSYALQGNGDLWVMQGANHVLTLTVNSSTGAYTVSQVAPIDHPAGLDENNDSFTINYRVTDGDGDTVDGSITVNVDDDTPTVSANGAQPSLTVDETVLGTNDTKDFSGIFSHSFGADGAAASNSVTYALAITGGNGVDSGLDDVATGQNIVLVNNNGVIEGHVGSTVGALAFTVTVDGSGNVTLDQIRAVVHPNAADPDDSVTLANDNLITLTQTVTDHDGDSASATANIGQNLNFEDDGPSAAIVVSTANVSVDESVGIQADSNDTTDAAVVALFAGVANKGVDTDLPQYATNANAVVTSAGTAFGADGGAASFSLNVSSAGVDSGLNTTDGQDIFLFKEGNLVVGRVGGAGGPAAFAIAIDSSGHISTVEYLSIQHANPANPDDVASIANGALLATVTATDGDGDTNSASAAIGSHIQFQDSGPVMTSASNINIQNSGDVAHTGAFAFNLGADGANTSNDVITNVTGSATVGGVPVQNWTLTAGSETATTASYSFSFDYSVGNGATAHETGTLTFDKAGGTYTIDLDNPIQGVTTILQTAQGTLFQGYEFGTSTPDGSQPEISVTQIQDLAGTANDIYVQFTGVAEPSSGTGDNNLELTSWVPGANNPPPVNGGGDTTFNAGDLFNQTDSWVSTSNSANGVAGDTIQGGEVLDFSLVQGANPTGTLANPATYAQASAMFLKFDGIGSGEDMIVVLKLYDPTTNAYTTRAVMIQNSDIIKGPGAGPGQYSGVTLDNNDGLVIIESNDFNLPGEHWVIVGAQVAGSDEGITGTAINLNGAIGAAGDSITGNAFDTQSFATDTNDGPFKISSIGFLTTQTTPQNAQLDFNVTVTDGDGDSVTQAISATVTPAADSSTPIALSAAVTTVAPVVLDLNGDGVHFLGTDAGVHYDYGNGSVATAWAAPQDGILVNDANHDGKASASEFVFGANGTTDLQALNAYDTNHDGQLSSADAGFANFAVWQDANSNGKVDAGEMQSLTARGIASISLSSDGISYTAAGGDVQVAGTGTYTRIDGTKGSLADAAFVTDATRPVANSNAVLMGALAAAGLAAEGAAAATTHASLAASTAMAGVTAAHNQALAPIALEAHPDLHASTQLSGSLTDLHGLMQAQASLMHPADFGEHALRLDAGHATALPTAAFAQGTQLPGHDAPVSPVMAAAVAMPSVQQLVGGNLSSVGGAHNQVIGQVLADALHGGGNGPTIDSVLNALPGQANAHAGALEALASHGGAAVASGDMSAFANVFAGNGHINMEQLAVHADAAPLHA